MVSSSSTIPPPTPSSPSSLFAAIDMGTNSFKLLIVPAQPTGCFLPLLRRKDPILLGRRHYHQTPTSPYTISAFSELCALKALNTFQTLLWAHNIPTTHTHCVATSAVRETANKSELLENVREKTGLEVKVLSGEEKARLVYLGTLQFFPMFEKLVLCVDIGGGGANRERGVVGEDDGGQSEKMVAGRRRLLCRKACSSQALMAENGGNEKMKNSVLYRRKERRSLADKKAEESGLKKGIKKKLRRGRLKRKLERKSK